MSKFRSFLTRKYLIIALTLLGMLLVSLLWLNGIIWPNEWFTKAYHVKGLDVSSYQKQIDWKRVAQTGEYQFVFIKATEGKDYKDAYFRANWQGTQANGILRGAYHFYRENLTPTEQAENFISMVPKEAGMLPPVLDLEVGGGQERERMIRDIKTLLDLLEQHYGIKPIIYTDLIRYGDYVKEHFSDYPLWIGEALFPIQWSGPHNWSFWQYCDRCRVAGIPEPVDVNVFYAKSDRLK